MNPIEEIEKIAGEDITSPKSISFFFHISMWWRIFYGFLRILLGIAFLRLIGKPLAELVYSLMSHEVTGRKTDIVLGKIYALFETHDFTVTYFIAGYFIFWGTVDIVLSFCLLKKVIHAFPVAMALIALFICYGVFRFSFTHSLVLAGVILVDIVILFLINSEYVLLKKERTTH